jgi:hypothetical protein
VSKEYIYTCFVIIHSGMQNVTELKLVIFLSVMGYIYRIYLLMISTGLIFFSVTDLYPEFIT